MKHNHQSCLLETTHNKNSYEKATSNQQTSQSETHYVEFNEQNAPNNQIWIP